MRVASEGLVGGQAGAGQGAGPGGFPPESDAGVLALLLLAPLRRTIGIHRADGELDQAQQVHPRPALAEAVQDHPLSTGEHVRIGKDVCLLDDHLDRAGGQAAIGEGLPDAGQPLLQRPGDPDQLPCAGDGHAQLEGDLAGQPVIPEAVAIGSGAAPDHLAHHRQLPRLHPRGGSGPLAQQPEHLIVGRPGARAVRPR